ncbi:MAG: hypothetical protein JSR69_03395 [Proteobacteria bacterium]|nr:hypothetical protein [Pseudomonadota bacterium]
MISVALNGLGRFGQHLIHAWLAAGECEFSIDYACDEYLSAEAVCTLLREHDRLDFSSAAPTVEAGCLCLTRADGVRLCIAFHHGSAIHAPWLGEPGLWLECSGRYSIAADCQPFLKGKTGHVLISATSWDADQTLVMGFNQGDLHSKSRVISYGSCTVNAFVPLAHWLHDTCGVREAQANIIHNVPAHRLVEHAHPARRTCTLEFMAPRLLPWLDADRFFVGYALIPYTGASLIDLRFRLCDPPSRPVFLSALQAACTDGVLAGRYALLDQDPGVQGALGAPWNAMFYEAGIALKGDTLCLAGYFDNENSAFRYLELVNWLSEHAVLG